MKEQDTEILASIEQRAEEAVDTESEAPNDSSPSGQDVLPEEEELRVSCFAGRLKNYRDVWRDFTSDRLILSWIEGCKIPLSERPVQTRAPKETH